MFFILIYVFFFFTFVFFYNQVWFLEERSIGEETESVGAPCQLCEKPGVKLTALRWFSQALARSVTQRVGEGVGGEGGRGFKNFIVWFNLSPPLCVLQWISPGYDQALPR